jgi:uncharacterized membrane protein YdjX (TVP38/TMEM64 family)
MRRIVFACIVMLIAGYAAWSYLDGGIISTMVRPGVPGEQRLQAIRAYFDSWGSLAPLGYTLIVTVEVVVAPIPGTVLYLPGGVIFGWWIGGLASLAGNVAGAGLACQIMRSLARSRIEPYLETGRLKKYQGVLERRGLWIIFLLRINPLTSSDIVSYAAGLTRLPVWKVMVGTLFGMAPLCFIQAYFAEELFTTFPFLIYPLILIGIGYVLYAAWAVRRILRGPGSRDILPS